MYERKRKRQHRQSRAAAATCRWDQMADFRTPFGIRRQLRLLTPLLGTWAAAGLVLAAAGVQQWAPLKQLFLDASYLGGQPWYSGILNEAGLIAWAVAATAATLGSWVARLDGRPGAARFLGWGAVVVVLMLTDVWIQFHSAVAPRLGIPSTLAQVAIAVSGLGWLGCFWREIARTRWLILLASFAVLGCSACIDTVIDPVGALGLWIEDAARLVGILTFTHYLVVTTADVVRSVAGRRPTPAESPLTPRRTTPSISRTVPRPRQAPAPETTRADR